MYYQLRVKKEDIAKTLNECETKGLSLVSIVENVVVTIDVVQSDYCFIILRSEK